MEKPCLKCTRIKDPGNCENKECQVWRRWFLFEWARIRAGANALKEKDKK